MSPVPPSTRPMPAGVPLRYDGVAIALHWVLAAAIAGLVGIGATMSDLPVSPLRLRLYNWHKWAGVVVLALTLLRLAWHATHRGPPGLAQPRWQRDLARGVRRAMLSLCLAVPLAGWAYSSAAGFPVVLFGVLPLPEFVAADRELAEAIKPLHGALAYTLAALAALHAAAALKHQFVDRDGLLTRMMPGRRRRAERRTEA